jgi:hypothetical protein
VTLARLSRDIKLSERTARRALHHVTQHGWWKPSTPPPGAKPAERRKLAGQVLAGHDCDCAPDVARACSVCGEPLTGRRHQQTCSGRCRQAASRDRKRDRSAAESVTAEDRKRDMSRQESVTVTAPKCDKPQVSPGIVLEAATRGVGRDAGLRCIAPGCGKPPRRACRTCWEHAAFEVSAVWPPVGGQT